MKAQIKDFLNRVGFLCRCMFFVIAGISTYLYFFHHNSYLDIPYAEMTDRIRFYGVGQSLIGGGIALVLACWAFNPPEEENYLGWLIFGSLAVAGLTLFG